MSGEPANPSVISYRLGAGKPFFHQKTVVLNLKSFFSDKNSILVISKIAIRSVAMANTTGRPLPKRAPARGEHSC